jgi:hypothetical protein
MKSSLANTNKATVSSAELQAAFVYNFMLFSQWPEAKKERVLCTAGQNRDSLELKTLTGRLLNDTVIRVVSVVNDTELAQCDALFIASLEYMPLVDSVGSLPLLVFSNLMPDYVRGISIMLANQGNRVVFDVDLVSLHRSGVHLSSSVLRLARSTRD